MGIRRIQYPDKNNNNNQINGLQLDIDQLKATKPGQSTQHTLPHTYHTITITDITNVHRD